jgi:4-amino-4-deoxy-L-arabinose transferase-like glycosyltransferase
MTRRLLNLVTLLSLLLCVAVVVLWVRSYRYVDELSYQSERVKLVDWEMIVSFMGGRLLYFSDMHEYDVPPDIQPPPEDPGFSSWHGSSDSFLPGEAVLYVEELDRTQMAGTYILFRRFGFHFARSAYHDSHPGQVGMYRTTTVHVPLWFVTALLAIAPVSVALRWLRRRRRVGCGLCRSCGYDLRATRDRCPECGEAP